MQSVSLSFSHLLTQSYSLSVGQSVCLSVSQSLSQSINQSTLSKPYYNNQSYSVVSVRSDSTPDTSPEFGSHYRVPKRRIHRSSAPANLSTGSSLLSSPSSTIAPATIKPEPQEPESPDVFMSISMDSEPSVNQDTDLEIEGGGAEMESIDPGMMEFMEMEEEEDVNGDVIRCLCNESEEGGFMIQVTV